MADAPTSQIPNHVTDFTLKPRILVSDDPTGTPVDGYIDTDDIYDIAVTATNNKITALGTLGDVVGPGSATDGHVALFDGATGKLIKDGGAYSAGVAPVSPSVTDNIVTFSNTTGGQKDSGYAISDFIVPSNRTLTNVTATYSALASDDLIIANKATPMTVTLIAATGSGRKVSVASIGAGVVTVDVTGGGYINAALSMVLNQWDTADFVDIASGQYLFVKYG